MSIGRGIMAALSGGLTGLAEAAVREDEKRDELSKVTLAQAMNNIEQAKELARKRQEEIKEENETVESLMSYETDTGKPISRGQAIKAYRQYGKNAASMLLQGQLSFEGEGTVVEKPAVQRGTLDLEATGAMQETGGLFARGRGEALAKRTEQGLKAAGYTAKGVDIPQRVEVEGVTVRAGKGLADVQRQQLYTNTPGLESVTRVDTVMPDGSKTTIYENPMGENVTEQVKTAQQQESFKIATDSNDLYSGIKPDGIAFKIGGDGVPKPLPFVVGYDQNGAAYRKDDTGEFNIKITDPSVLTLNSYQLDALGGADGVENVFDVLGNTGRKDYTEFKDQAESFGRAVNVVKNQNALLDEHGDALVADIGSVSEFIEYAKVNFGVGVEVVKEAGQEFLDLSESDFAILESKREDLERAQAEETDPRKKLAIARRLYQANQILFAYASARSVTNDTRISNQDFDLFFKTVSGSSASAQRAIYQNRLLDAKVAVTEKYTTLQTTAQARGEGAMAILDSIPESRTPSGLDQTIIDVFETTTPAKTTEEVKQEAEEVSKERSNYLVQKRLVNPDTGEPDPNGIEAIVVERNGQVQKYPDGTPVVFDPNEYSQDSVEGYILNGLIRDNKIVAPKD